MDNDYFYIIGLLFIPALIVELFASKKTMTRESAELVHYTNNPFEVLDFMKKKGARIIIGTLYHFWIIYGIIVSEQRYWFVVLLLLYVVATYIFIRNNKQTHTIDIVLAILGMLFLCFIVYRHFYILTA